MRLTILFAILFLFAISCDHRTSAELEYILISRNSKQLNTKKRIVLSNLVTDSFRIISYRTTFREKTYDEKIKLPIKPEYDSLTRWKFSAIRSYDLDKKQYQVVRYLYDDMESADEEMFLFYTLDFGVLNFKSPVFGSADRLTRTGDLTKDRIILYLNERIENDMLFYWE